MKTNRKIAPLGISPFCSQKLGEDQKKRSSLKFSPDSVRLCAQTFCTSNKGRGRVALLHIILCKFYYPGDPKGGPWHHALPLNTPLPKCFSEVGLKVDPKTKTAWANADILSLLWEDNFFALFVLSDRRSVGSSQGFRAGSR